MHVWSDRIEKNLSGLADFNDGKELGIQEGKELGIQEMVINFYNNNVPIEIISKSANLSIDKVNEIIRNSENKSN